MASTQIPNYETRSLANNLKSKNQELSSLFMTHRINGMHALIKFPEYIPYGLGVMARARSGTYGRTDGRMDRWTDGQADVRDGHRRGHSSGVMARTRLTIWNLVKGK